jgi:hypothetical protein
MWTEVPLCCSMALLVAGKPVPISVTQARDFAVVAAD